MAIQQDLEPQAGSRHALRRAQVDADHADPVGTLARELGTEPLAMVALFLSPAADFDRLVSEAHAAFGGADVVACTTAGEIGAGGYAQGTIIAIGFPRRHFATTSILIEELQDHSSQTVLDRIALDRVALQKSCPDKRHGFAFLLVDGLSLREDMLTVAIAPALRDMALFGGSAGDGMDFGHTRVALNGRSCENAAVLTLIQSDLRVKVFSIDHLVPTDTQMVVTGADPDKRIVKSINAEPAAREYARLVGKDPEQLDQFTFASHPVVVRIGSDHHVRAIQQVRQGGELLFFSAIDEGMVLTLAEPQDMVAHLRGKLEELEAAGPLTDIVGCDCVLRRIEAEQKQTTRAMSAVLSDHRVIGFSTYGEQIGALHVNHTMTGVAIYAPQPDTD
ncbi:GfdT protein [Sulfitobacter alexandrii]|uniref:GfdT protein n=1 Tax=Sulfitobacter alexandrii TaxID=1917485 RepID=A0A1J0WH40_9RHOB|nr:FIST N-terminal domain-containing protein [Sulfitobacter alexandrii]APE43504.1 GfdT protein [Sulfitobacter alexandrii]